MLKTGSREAVVWRCSVEKGACNFIWNETLAEVFFCDFAKFLRTPFFKNTFMEHFWWLPLEQD